MTPDISGGQPAPQTVQNAGNEAPPQRAETTEGQGRESEVSTQKSEARGLMDLLDIPADLQAQIGGQSTEGQAAETAAPTPKTEEGETTPAEQEPEEEPDETDTDAEEKVEPEKPEDKGQPDKRQKRINRLTRQKKELEDRLDSVAAENHQFREYFGKLQQGIIRGQNAVPVGTGRLAHVMDEQQLGQEVAQAQGVIEWCEANADGVTTGEGDNQKFVEPNEIAQWRRAAEKVVLNAPERRDQIRGFTQARAGFDQTAHQIWPELFDRSSKEHQEASALLATFPQIALLPQASLAVGLVLEGIKSVQARQAKNGNAADTAAATRRDISPRVFEPRVPLSPSTANPPSRPAAAGPQKKLKEAMTSLAADPDGGADSIARAFSALGEMGGRRDSRRPVKV